MNSQVINNLNYEHSKKLLHDLKMLEANHSHLTKHKNTQGQKCITQRNK